MNFYVALLTAKTKILYKEVICFKKIIIHCVPFEFFMVFLPMINFLG